MSKIKEITDYLKGVSFEGIDIPMMREKFGARWFNKWCRYHLQEGRLILYARGLKIDSQKYNGVNSKYYKKKLKAAMERGLWDIDFEFAKRNF